LQLAAYAERLSAYPAQSVLRVLNDWPMRSPWWPSWHELAEQLPSQQPAYQPREMPEHRLLNGPRRDDASMHRPFTPAERREFEDAMATLRDGSIPALLRNHLLGIGEQIEARQGSQA